MSTVAIKSYRDLLVWQESMAMVTHIYRATRSFLKEELYGLTSQIRRSAVSIPSNIAEGYGRRATNEYIRFLNIAVGSLYELQTQTEIARILAYLPPQDFDDLYSSTRELERMLTSLIAKLKAK